MYVLIVSLIIFISVLMILVILAQNPKGGLSSQFTSGGGAQFMGVKRTSDLLEKLTWGFAIAILVLSLSIKVFLVPTSTDGVINSNNIERAQEKTILPGMNQSLPSSGTSEGESGSSDMNLDDLTSGEEE